MAARDTGPSAAPSDLIHGVDVAFQVATVLAFAGLALAFFIPRREPAVAAE